MNEISHRHFARLWQVQKCYIAEHLFFGECFPITAALKYNHHINIIKITESLRLLWYKKVTGRWIEIKIS